MENELVRYSRAGDTFHYRWAARRCLRMLHPKALLRCVIIEGSNEKKMAGEYVIDVAEYSGISDEDLQKIDYYQLKHTTVRKELPFNLSDLEDTIEGFAKRFIAYCDTKNESEDAPNITFTIVTNRPIAHSFKDNIQKIINGDVVKKRFSNTIEKYTTLKGEKLKEFCACLLFMDGEGDYNAQKYDLHLEISQILAGTVDNPQIDSITTLVQEKVLPDSDGRIMREDIFKRFGVTSDRDLFPSPPEYEKLENTILRKQHNEIIELILTNSNPTIIHAAGGVGKSVISRQIIRSLPSGSFGIVYDCFGGGRYRNRSEPRHRYRDSLVQIVNELAAHGLCEPLIALSNALEDEILRQFLSRLDVAVEALKKENENAVLTILIDAADNAEMAAREYGHSCFAHELLRESLPEGCKLAMLCRTERINLLEPSSFVNQIELKPFSQEESLFYLKSVFPESTQEDGTEFHRLTGGNPRVQSNVLNRGFKNITEVLNSLGPVGTTVEEQIELQLDNAISIIKEKLSSNYQSQIDAICLGLANLPPFIPLRVLAKAAEVNEATVRSFISELGHPLWLTDNSVQFRDEPTETWFRKRFSAKKEQILSYITQLKPMAYEYTYVAEVLPSLLLQAEQYSELIELTVSDKYLPEDNPIDRRNVRVYRLQFAFKAALKLGRYEDSIKLALLAGEETAGDKRQLKLIKENIDLLAPLQSEQRIQELAFRRMISGAWDGSQNVYSAAMLSSVNEFKGEARGYLRAGINWLHLYFQERKNQEGFHHNKIEDEDLVELAFAHLNLFGVTKTVEFLLNWQPKEVTFRITQILIRRIIDLGNFDAIYEMLRIVPKNPYFVVAVVHELLEVGKLPEKDTIERCLDLLTFSRTRMDKPAHSYNNDILSAIVSFAEVCAVNKLSQRKILRVLRYYFPKRAPRIITSNFQERERDPFLRAVALKSVLTENLNLNLDEVIPEEFSKKENKYRYEHDIQEFKQIMKGLLPWYFARIQILIDNVADPLKAVEDSSQQSKKVIDNRWKEFDILPYEISKVIIDILMFSNGVDSSLINKIFTNYLKTNNQIRIQDQMKAVRAGFRLSHLSEIRDELENTIYEIVSASSSEDTETRADWYVQLSRAVLPVNRDDAAAYFDYAVESISKFGDEIVQRWEAIAALGKRSAKEENESSELAYRFIRCAELIGDNVAREKYFDRNEAIRICVRLSPTSALASLSRWRDRDVGWFDSQLPELAKEIVESDHIQPTVAWSLSAFLKEYEIADFASICIEKEQSEKVRQHILNKAIRDIRLSDTQKGSYKELNRIATDYNLNNIELDEIKAYYANNHDETSESTSKENSLPEYAKDLEDINWEQLFLNLDLTSNNGIKLALKRFDGIEDKFFHRKTFWQEMFYRIRENEIQTFLENLINVEQISLYGLEDVFSYMPKNWLKKVSIQRNINKLLKQIARRFSVELSNKYVLEHFLKNVQLENYDINSIYEGIIEGLANNSDLADAETFFGFVQITSSLISPSNATELLDFGLNRFEIHIDDDYADGLWLNWLKPPQEISEAFAGFVWSALGSPKSTIRWQAVHCVRRLAESNCKNEIDALITWMENDDVGAFGSNKLPFYKLHARLYLLIGLARVSIDFPQLLKDRRATFLKIAIDSFTHVLIQKYSAEIALNIEKLFPSTNSKEVISQLQMIGKSQLPVKTIDKSEQKIGSSYSDEENDTDPKFYHGYDLDRYWFEPLGEVFGITGQLVEKLATEVIINEWNIDSDGGYQSDPRQSQWRSNRNEQEIMHSHGSYPRTDSYSFYLSYHSMFVVAAKLLKDKHIVQSKDWQEDPWNEWINDHLLTRNDGQWLADRRDPTPLKEKDWSKINKENWNTDISSGDFLDGLICEHLGDKWLNIFGSWTEGNNDCEESFLVSSALVSPQGAQSLLNALTSCSDPHDFKLPDYQEGRMELNLEPFNLRGWVWSEYIPKRIDEFDPHAAKIDYPPYQIGESIIKKMGLSVDSDLRKWLLPNTNTESIICRIWSTNNNEPDDEPFRKGNRLSASITFLKKLCTIMKCELIIEVQIRHRYKRNAYLGRDEEREYKPPFNKIYILSADGRLRDEESYYEIR
ncbi:ATP-binding protein [Aquibacillus albus]|uniref:ATP-binding protein n=1 Tax=Aquibacillus albus TaxID=1168171 RepID=A0ABS2N0B3_9BACI|nr:ATP-binding protein [Aquibacillus albus]MBM7571577.1 hypothetical protein [Aquibacillus albus]